MGINRVVISGNLTRDPELRATNSGTNVLTFGMAVNDRRKNQATGEWEDVPNFVDCTLFGSRAERLAQYLSKGSKVAIEGRLRYRSWEAQDGTKRSKLEVVVDEIEFMSRGEQGQQRPAQQAPAYPQPAYVARTMPAPAPQQPAYATQQPAQVYQTQAYQYAPQTAPQRPVAPPAPQQTAMPMPAQAAAYAEDDIPF